MMKLLKKSLLIPTCLTFLTASSQAALVLEFNEIGGTQVELSFSGSVDITGAFLLDDTLDHNTRLRVSFGSLSSSRGGTTNNFRRFDLYGGEDLLSGFIIDDSITSVDGAVGFLLRGSSLFIGSGLDGSVVVDSAGNVTILTANTGGGGWKDTNLQYNLRGLWSRCSPWKWVN